MLRVVGSAAQFQGEDVDFGGPKSDFFEHLAKERERLE